MMVAFTSVALKPFEMQSATERTRQGLFRHKIACLAHWLAFERRRVEEFDALLDCSFLSVSTDRASCHTYWLVHGTAVGYCTCRL